MRPECRRRRSRFTGRILDASGPGPVSLEVTTDPGQQRASLAWDPVVTDGAPVHYRLRTKGPLGPTQTQYGLVSPVVQQNLQVDATYEFTLDATDACNRTTSSVRLVRLNDATPPSAPIVAGPSFDPRREVGQALAWVAASDNIQVDHYSILRDGVPLGATDATHLRRPVAAAALRPHATSCAPSTRTAMRPIPRPR